MVTAMMDHNASKLAQSDNASGLTPAQTMATTSSKLVNPEMCILEIITTTFQSLGVVLLLDVPVVTLVSAKQLIAELVKVVASQALVSNNQPPKLKSHSLSTILILMMLRSSMV